MALLQFGTTLVFAVPPLWQNPNQPDPNLRKAQAIIGKNSVICCYLLLFAVICCYLLLFAVSCIHPTMCSAIYFYLFVITILVSSTLSMHRPCLFIFRVQSTFCSSSNWIYS
jgi:hypothetical protein